MEPVAARRALAARRGGNGSGWRRRLVFRNGRPNQLRRDKRRRLGPGGPSGHRWGGRRRRDSCGRRHERRRRHRWRYRPLRHLSSRKHPVRRGSQHRARALLRLRRKPVSGQARVGQDRQGRPRAGRRRVREHSVHDASARHDLHHLDHLRPIPKQERPRQISRCALVAKWRHRIQRRRRQNHGGGHVVHGIYVTGYSTTLPTATTTPKAWRRAIRPRRCTWSSTASASVISAASTMETQRPGQRRRQRNDGSPLLGQRHHLGGQGRRQRPLGGRGSRERRVQIRQGRLAVAVIVGAKREVRGRPYATAMLKGPSGNHFTLKAGNAQSGTLTKMWDGVRPSPGYSPKKLQGAIILGTGGDGSNGGTGTFFEGAMTTATRRRHGRPDPGEHRRRWLRSLITCRPPAPFWPSPPLLCRSRSPPSAGRRPSR